MRLPLVVLISSGLILACDDPDLDCFEGQQGCFGFNDEDGNFGPDGMPGEHPGTVNRRDVSTLWRFPVAKMTHEYTDPEDKFEMEIVRASQSTVQDMPLIPQVKLVPFWGDRGCRRR